MIVRYFLAEFDASIQVSFQEILDSCLQHFPRVSDTLVLIDGTQHGAILHRKSPAGGTYIHVALWTNDQPASLVPHNISGVSADLSERAPPPDSEYLDGDGMFLVSGNHCLVMSSGVLYKRMGKYLKKLFLKGIDQAVAPEKSDRFLLTASSDTDILEQINKDGGSNGINFRNGAPEVKPRYFLPVLYAAALVEMNRVLSIQAH